jgi:hypothetical protein
VKESEKIHNLINSLINEKQCESLIRNAKKLNRPDIVNAVIRKSIELYLKNYPCYLELSEVEVECLKAVYFYEKILQIKHGKKIKATYTWRAINNNGIIAAVNRIVSKESEPIGFTHLIEMGVLDLSFEAIVLKYPGSFTYNAVKKSQERMFSYLNNEVVK